MRYPLTVMMIPGTDETSFRVVFSTSLSDLRGRFTPARRITGSEHMSDWRRDPTKLIEDILALPEVRALVLEGNIWTVIPAKDAAITRAKNKVAAIVSAALNCSVASDDGYGYSIGGVQFLRPGELRILLIDGWPNQAGQQYVARTEVDLAIAMPPDAEPKVIMSKLGSIGCTAVVVDSEYKNGQAAVEISSRQ